MLDSFTRDIRFAFREYRRAPGAFTVAIVAMGLGIGGVTAVFSVVDRLMLRPLPYAEANRLVWIGMKAPISPDEFLLESDYRLLRDTNTVFDSVGAMSRTNDCDLNETEPVRLACTRVTHDLLPMLGVKPVFGRQFSADEDRPGGPRAAMLAFAFWRSRFGGDPQVIGRVLQIDGNPVRVAGVLPPDFEQPNLAISDIILTWQLNLSPGIQRSFLFGFGRLKPGIGVEAARTALLPLYEEMQKTIPPAFVREVSFHVTGMQARQMRDYRTASWVLLLCVSGLLLIACANVANLLLARNSAREDEFAVRAALGAGRGRILRQSLTESLLLAAAGGTTGVSLSWFFFHALRSWAPPGALRIQEGGLDGRVLAFAVGLTAASALLFGMAPAWRAVAMSALRSTRAGGSGWRISQSLMAVQIGLSVVLLSGASLLLQSLWKMQAVPLGLTIDDVHAIRIQLGAQRYNTPEKINGFFEQTFERLSRIPGTRIAAMTDSVPLYGGSRAMVFAAIDVEGRPVDKARPTGGMVVWRIVTPGYFAAMGIPIVRGRGFTHEDRVGADDLTIVDETLAARLFPGEDPIGKRVQPGRSGPFRTIIGIARHAKNAGLTQPDDPEYYNLWRVRGGIEGNRAHILLRSDADPAEIASFVRAEVGRIDPTVPVSVTTMRGNLARLLERPKVQTRLLTGLAVLGLVVAAIGQFGLVSYVVTQRTQEIGIRMALGATPRQVLQLIAVRVAAWTGAGAIAGLALTGWLGEYVKPLLFGVTVRDPWTAVFVIFVLAMASVLAVMPPVVRSVRVQPADALRHE